MKLSRSSGRRVFTVTLILISLLNTPAARPYAGRAPALSGRSQLYNIEAPDPSVPLTTADQRTKDRVSEAYGRLPLRFEENAGKVDREVKFLSRAGGYSLYLTHTEAVFALRVSQNRKATSDPAAVIRMKLVNGNPAPWIDGEEELPGKSNYLIGNDRSRWRKDVTSYAKVRYQGVYRGIDLLYYGNQSSLEYDFVVEPGADPGMIKLAFSGMKRMSVDARGDLVLHTTNGPLRHRKPVAYQEIDGSRHEVAAGYVLKGKCQVGFKLAAYDRARPLVIDPTLIYSTFLGGIYDDRAHGITVDRNGNAYVVGVTFSPDFPTANPVQATLGNRPLFECDGYITKFNPQGSAVMFSTFLGGKDIDVLSGIAVDRDGNIYLAGNTYSPDFPLKNPMQRSHAGSADAFAAKLNASGSELIFSTYIGGADSDLYSSMSLDADSNIYLAGITHSTDFPTKNPLQGRHSGGVTDYFVTKLKADGTELVYSTYLGGAGQENYPYIAVDLQGQAYLAGSTASTDFPTVNPFQPNHAGLSDATVTKLSADGTNIVFSSYLGGGNHDALQGIALDPLGAAYVAGYTRSTDFPTVDPIQPALSGRTDAYIAKVDGSGRRIEYSTYLGGSGDEFCSAIAVDLFGRAHITGTTTSSDFPTVNETQQLPDKGGDSGDCYIAVFEDVFVVRLNETGSRVLFSSYLGGGFREESGGIAVDLSGNIYVVGYTLSSNFPTTPGAFRRRPASCLVEAFVTKIGGFRFDSRERRRIERGGDGRPVIIE